MIVKKHIPLGKKKRTLPVLWLDDPAVEMQVYVPVQEPRPAGRQYSAELRKARAPIPTPSRYIFVRR